MLPRCPFFLCLLLLFTPIAFAQVVQSRPDLELASNGIVFAIARQNDGSMIIGGRFSKINGVSRANIARLLPNGALDPSWDPRTDGDVYALTLDASGNIYAGGNFSHVDGVALRNLAKIPGTGIGAAVASWVPAPNGVVRALTISGASLYVGGAFTQIGGASRSRVARVGTVGQGSADAWNPSADADVMALTYVDASSGSDVVIAGGYFTAIGGQSRNRLAKLSTSTGGADAVWNPSTNGGVLGLANDGNSVYVGGSFTMIGTLARQRIARISVTGTGMPLANFNPGANDLVQTVSVIGNNVYVGGWFTECGGIARARVARISANTGLVDAAWNPGAVGSGSDSAGGVGAIVYAMRGRSDGVAVIGGNFRVAAAEPRLSLARIEADGSTATPTHAALPARVGAFASAADGSVIVGGDFALADGQPRSNLLRLRIDGTLDPDWKPAVDGAVTQIAFDHLGRLYVAGGFSSVNEAPQRGIVRLSTIGAGEPDAGWNAQPDYFVFAMAIEADNSVLVGGSFSNIGGLAREHVARLSPDDATADPAWDPLADDWLFSLAVGVDGAVFAGGFFDNIGGQPRSNIAKLSATDGTADPAWQPVLDGSVNLLVAGADGVLYAGGYFSHADGLSRTAGLARFAADGIGAVDMSWNPPLSGNAMALAIDPSGAVYAGGTLYAESMQRWIYKLDRVTGVPAIDFQFSADGYASALHLDSGRLLVGGSFTSVLSTPRAALAGIAIDRLFANGFE